MSNVLLEMKGISKDFSGPLVLNDVSFELRAGETHVLAGENGAGKSTLMRILSGVYTEYVGEIRVKGQTVRFHSPQDAARHGISIIHQELSLVPDMSVADNIFLGREQTGALGWLRFGSERRACAALLRRLGVQATPDAPAGAYPIGVRQTMEIAKALSYDASIIVMDEPTSALTEPEVERLFSVIDDLKQRGCGIVYISHKMEEIYRIADRITVLRDGRRIGVADASDLPQSELICWMVGRYKSLSASSQIAPPARSQIAPPARSQIEFGNEQVPDAPASPGDVTLELHDVTVPDPGGRSRPVACQVSLSVRAGEIVGLAGLQGSGAGELMYGLYGAYGRVTTGDVRLCGAAYVPKSPRHALRHGLAMLSSDRTREGLVQGMSITHNITLGALAAYSPGGWLRERRERSAAQERQAAFGIRADTVDQPVETLSGGNQQKTALAKCLEMRPRALLLNEPTRGVDVGAKQDIYRLMAQWSAAGIAVLLITSEMPELIALSDRIAVMHQGRVTAMLDRAQANPETILAAAMGDVAQTASSQELHEHE